MTCTILWTSAALFVISHTIFYTSATNLQLPIRLSLLINGLRYQILHPLCYLLRRQDGSLFLSLYVGLCIMLWGWFHVTGQILLFIGSFYCTESPSYTVLTHTLRCTECSIHLYIGSFAPRLDRQATSSVPSNTIETLRPPALMRVTFSLLCYR